MAWLNNAWFVGIATGVLSGLLVTWLLQLFLSKREDREFKQQVATANREIIYAIRGGIPDNALPNREIVEALIHSTARRYNLETTDLYQPKEFVEELIKEVMDSNFLSTAQKSKYCKELQETMLSIGHLHRPDVRDYLEVERFMAEPHSAEIEPEDRAIYAKAIQRSVAVEEERSSKILQSSSAAGVLVGLSTSLLTVASLFPSLEAKLYAIAKSFGFSLLIGIVVALAALLVTVWTTRNFSEHLSEKRKAEKEKE